MKRIFILFLFKICFLNFIAGQSYQLSQVISPSPTAFSISKYGEIPVNYYNGNVNASLQLYEIKTNNFSLPIELRYNSSGIKVGENAGWVGLGWTLQANGVITRTVVGVDDFRNNGTVMGYYYAPTLPANMNFKIMDRSFFQAEPTVVTMFDKVNKGEYDSEPDIYHYNFGNYSGKFILGKNANGSPVFFDQQNNLKVEYVETGSNWKITDPFGYKYYFTTKERSTTYSRSSDTELPDNVDIEGLYATPDVNVSNAWYVDSIVAPTSEVITFTYEQNCQSLSLLNKSVTVYRQLSLSGGCTSGTACTESFPATKSIYGHSKQIIYDITLKKINFKAGSVEFVTTDRDDIDYRNTTKSAKLSEIIVKNVNDQVIRKINLYHSYFRTSTTATSTVQKRLKLDSLIETGTGTQRLMHTFNYFSPDNIPTKYTKGIDHWGYYNGKTTNSALFPSRTLESDAMYFPGGDRTSDQSIDNLKKGVLSSIVYPTGGSTQFEYELNEYGNLTGDDQYDLVHQSIQASALFGNTQNLTKSFDVSAADAPATITFSTTFKKTVEDDGVASIGDYAHVTRDGVAVYDFIETAQSQPGFYSHPQTITKVLPAGHYVIDVRSLQGYNTTLTADWDKKVLASKRKGGGIRISAIINYENGKKVKTRKFVYENEDGTTSGKLLAPFIYDYISRGVIYDGSSSSCQASCNWVSDFLVQMCYAIPQLPFVANVGNIGYSRVIELDGENGENGKTEYLYANTPYTSNANVKLPFINYYQQHPLNGRLGSKSVYKANGDLVSKQVSSSQILQTNTLQCAKVFSDPWSNPDITMFSQPRYSIQAYDNISNWIVKSYDEETYRAENGNLLISKTNYYYDNPSHLNRTRSESFKSDGIKEVEIINYAQDYLSGTSWIDQMVSSHIISKPIETVNYNIEPGGAIKITKGTITTFKTGGKGLEDAIKKLEITAPVNLSGFKFSNATIGNLPTSSSKGTFSVDPKYQDRASFITYDVLGNILERSKINDVTESFLWDNNNSYPIFSVTNAYVKDIFHTSFEDADGNSANDDSKTGRKSRTNGYSRSLSNLTNGDYVLSYWKKSAGVWILEKSTVSVTGGNYAINLSGQVDEVRFHPKTSKMTTYTYDPLIGMTSQCDMNNKITYYEYDSFGRLKNILDQDRNVLKTYDYQYQQNNNQ